MWSTSSASASTPQAAANSTTLCHDNRAPSRCELPCTNARSSADTGAPQHRLRAPSRAPRRGVIPLLLGLAHRADDRQAEIAFHVPLEAQRSIEVLETERAAETDRHSGDDREHQRYFGAVRALQRQPRTLDDRDVDQLALIH